MRERGFEPEFPEEAERQLAELAAHPPIVAPASGGHEIRDLRGLLWSSIDNDTSRDLDQLEVVEPLAGGETKVLIAIADVDAFVPKHSPIDASFMYSDSAGFHFMDQESFETLTLNGDRVGDDRELLVDNLIVQVQKYNGNPIGLQFPPHVELTVTSTEPGVRGDTASGGVTKPATLQTGLEIRVPLFIKEGDRVKVHTETREFAGRA